MYKKEFDYPESKGIYLCHTCGNTGELPVNYCQHCGKELNEANKKGLLN